jgi:hypothetical protein
LLLIPVSVSNGEALGGSVTTNLMYTPGRNAPDINSVRVLWHSADNKHGDGTLFTVLFRAGPEYSGCAEIELVSGGIFDENQNPVPVTLRRVSCSFCL